MKKRHVRGFLPYLLLVVFMAFTMGVNAQQKTIQGNVTDETGAPLPGVTVVVKGTTQGTITGVDGNYTLDVPVDANVLVFSYIGMTSQEVEISNRTSINVELQPDVIGIEEVVAVGYATRKAGEVTGSVSSVQAADIEEMTVVDASEALRTASGVTVLKSNTPGEGASIRVRGLGTINDNDPLWVVDGVPGGSVTPNNIESITILKDAAAQAIYGARAANGVVLVTTKTGRRNQKAQVNVNVKTGVSKNSNYYDLLNTREYGEMLWLEAANDGVSPNHALYGSGSEPDIPEYIRPARAENVDHSLYDNKMIHEDGDDTYLITKANQEGTEWLKEADRNAQFRDISVDLSGGSQNTSYAFQLGYMLEEGILKHTGFDRYNLRSNVTTSPVDWIEIGERLGVTYSQDYGHQENNTEASIVSWAYRMQPIIPVYDIAGNYAGTRAEGTGNSQNPIFLLDSNKDDKTKRMNVSGNTYIKLMPIDGLSIQTLFGIDYTARHYRNPNFVEKAHAERGKYASLSEETSFNMQWNWTNTLQYSKLIADEHDLTVLLGTEAIDYSYNFINASRSEFFSKEINYMQLATGLQGINNDGNNSSWALFSMFGRLNYNYQNKYMLEAVVRRDGSSRFGGDNRYGVFPAFSAAWRISNENFMASTSSWLDDLKIRAGYGTTGNDRVGNYNSYTNFAIDYVDSFYAIDGANVTTGTTGFYQSTFGNPDVKWETTKTTNLGIDGAFNNNLTVSLDLWQRVTSDMLYPKQIPMVLGRASAPSINVGEMKNRGFDIELGYLGNALNGDLTYDVNFNISHYKNEIVKLSDNEDEFLGGDAFREMVYTRSQIGTAFPEFYGYVVEGIFQDQAEADAWPTAFGEDGTYNEPGHYKIKDVTEDGVINSDDRTYIGSPHPDFTAALNFHVNYKGFGVVAHFYSSYGNEMVNYVRRFIDFRQFQGGRSKDRLYSSWGSPYLDNNENAKLPKAESNDNESQLPSTAFVEDASYLRLENLRISYDLNRVLHGDYFRNLQVYGQMSNVFTITKYSGLDPEVNSGGRNLGVDSGAWPTPKQIMFGINIGL
ncbi:TonB-linked outer membrane protein, SusC/RagA family [Tangfeifania diversioriginum]|uniref:TonB-linked outer membrane protein, SusC/RagA family n=1 Tax=Tangfeifania diversioriginum TaxID=1168035 RepID=A0A1M6C666_9BACT|nr:TonB-dependent receptor [Tangfeifania diversioriginum]SHI56452.1 TonB-linked outer membrane protein, SusC/RagA family [Tangfeifania diversioriginum]